MPCPRRVRRVVFYLQILLLREVASEYSDKIGVYIRVK